MGQVINWLKESNRWKHILGGIALGLASDGWYCATLVGLTAGGCLEYKDYKHQSKWDWIDFGLTAGGSIVGYFLRWLF